MEAVISIDGQSFKVNLAQPIDISIPLDPNQPGPNAWNAKPFTISPVRAGDWVGSVTEGGSVNFFDVQLNPHGNGTHTECVGHISSEGYTINQALKQFHCLADVISVKPHRLKNGDQVITEGQLAALLPASPAKAVVIRTIPNDSDKLTRHYMGTNPPFFEPEALQLLVELNIEHLLTDLPSVDREKDEGKLSAHHVFWKYPGPQTRTQATITEMIFVPDSVADGRYLLNLSIPSFEMDAAPSKPVLYRLQVV